MAHVFGVSIIISLKIGIIITRLPREDLAISILYPRDRISKLSEIFITCLK